MKSLKIPSSVQVKVTFKDIQLCLPAETLKSEEVEACVFVGRQSYNATTRRTKWFSTWNTDELPIATVADLSEQCSKLNGASNVPMNESAPKAQKQAGAEYYSGTTMTLLQWGSLNEVEYIVSLKPLGQYDGNLVFDKKITHPVNLSVKIKSLHKPHNITVPGSASPDADEEFDDDFSDHELESDFDMPSRDDAANNNRRKSVATEMSDSATTRERQQRNVRQISGIGIDNVGAQTRVLQFPHGVDVAQVMNRANHSYTFFEPLQSKSTTFKEAMLRFTVTAEIYKDEKTLKAEEKMRRKCEEEEKKRLEKGAKEREKELKRIAKEGKKQEEKELKAQEKAAKKTADGHKKNKYGEDVSDEDAQMATVKKETTEAHDGHNDQSADDSAHGLNSASNRSANAHPDDVPSIGPPHAMPTFAAADMLPPVEHTTCNESSFKNTSEGSFKSDNQYTPFPYFVVVDNFALSSLSQPLPYYRGVEIRLAIQDAIKEVYPMLDLPCDKAHLTTNTVTAEDGTTSEVPAYEYLKSPLFFADERIKSILGHNTIRALVKHEQGFLKAEQEGVSHKPHDVFENEFLKVGAKFNTLTLLSLPQAASGAQAMGSLALQLCPQLRVPAKVKGLEDVKSKEQRARERQERKERKQKEKEAKKELKRQKSVVKNENGEEPPSSIAADETNENGNAAATESGEHHEDEETEFVDVLDEEEKKEVDGPSAPEDGVVSVEGGVPQESHESTPAIPVTDLYSEKSKLLLPASRTLRFNDLVYNQEWFPKEGITYYVRYDNNENVSFRVRRFFIASCCKCGKSGGLNENSLMNCEYIHE